MSSVTPPPEWSKNKSFGDAFRHAWDGVRFVIRSEKNIRREIYILGVVLVLAVVLRISFLELAVIIIASGVVFAAEMVNTSIEMIEDIVWPEFRMAVKHSKDIAAGAVLVSSGAAVVVGLLIFLPYAWKMVLYLS